MWISMPLVGHVKGTLCESTEHRETAASIFSEVEPRRLTQGQLLPCTPLCPTKVKFHLPLGTSTLLYWCPDSPITHPGSGEVNGKSLLF